MARPGNRRFKKSRTKTFMDVRDGAVVRVMVEQIKGQKLRDRTEKVEQFTPTATLKNIPGVWIGKWS